MDPGLRSLIPEGLRLEMVMLETTSITVVAAPTGGTARCPVCGHPSSRVHRRGTRTLADVPWGSKAASIQVNIRHFRCLSPLCPRKIFAERLGDTAQVFARRTNRLGTELSELALALGGEPGARLATELGMAISGDTLLRLIRATPLPDSSAVRVLGVDDWAVSKGRVYGTILVDLERHCPIDLLPDRTSASLALWIRKHPQVEMVSRDRAESYANGASQGAPDALEVADRWHLLRNLREAAERFCIRRHSDMPTSSPKKAAIPTGEQVEAPDTAPEPCQSSKEQVSHARRERRKGRYDEVKGLHQRGMGIRAIARTVGLNRKTVSKYVRLPEFPEMAKRRRRGSVLDPYREYLDRRWSEGCHNGALLLEELRPLGYTGGRSVVAEYLTQLRSEPQTGTEAATHRSPRVSAKEASWLLVRPIEDLSDRQRGELDELLESCPDSGTVRTLAQAFGDMVRQRQSGVLGGWLEDAEKSGIRELGEFARGLRQDRSAVEAALSVEYSNGQTEGQVNRLKLIKRQMYGRAGLDLLRRRVLHRDQRRDHRTLRWCDPATRAPPPDQHIARRYCLHDEKGAHYIW